LSRLFVDFQQIEELLTYVLTLGLITDKWAKRFHLLNGKLAEIGVLVGETALRLVLFIAKVVVTRHLHV